MPHVFSRLLLATEHSEHDCGAEAVAFALAKRCGLALDAVLPIASNPEYEAIAPQLAAHADAQAGGHIQALADAAQRAGVTLDLKARRGPEAWQEIVDEATQRGSDLIVIRRRGQRGLLANLLLGETVRNVVAHAPCSVLVVPREAQMWSRRVLAAVDPDALDMTPVATAAAAAAECGLPLSLVCVADPAADALQKAEQALQRAWSTARGFPVAIDALTRIGRPQDQIHAVAKEIGADLVVIGRHRDDSLARAWLGGVAQKVIGLADRPVLVSVSRPTTSKQP